MQRLSPKFRSQIAENVFTQIYRDLYGDAMLVLIRINTNVAAGTNKNICH